MINEYLKSNWDRGDCFHQFLIAKKVKWDTFVAPRSCLFLTDNVKVSSSYLK